MCSRGGSNVVVAFDGRLDGLGMPSARAGARERRDPQTSRDGQTRSRHPPGRTCRRTIACRGIASSRASMWRGGRRVPFGTIRTWARRAGRLRGDGAGTAPARRGRGPSGCIPPPWPGAGATPRAAPPAPRARCPPVDFLVRASPSPIHPRSGSSRRRRSRRLSRGFSSSSRASPATFPASFPRRRPRPSSSPPTLSACSGLGDRAAPRTTGRFAPSVPAYPPATRASFA